MKNKKINIQNMYIIVSIFIITLALSTDSFIRIIYKNRFIQILTIIIGIAFFMINALKKFNGKINKKILKLQIMWLITLFFVLYNNNDFRNGIAISYPIYYIIGIIFIIILKYNKKWIVYFSKFLVFNSVIYAFFTILFRLFKPLYNYFIHKVYSGAILNQLIQQYEENHMAGIASHYSTNAIYLVLGIGIIITFFNINKKYKSNYKIMLIILILALIFNGKRGTVIFGVLSILITYLSEIPLDNIKKYIKFYFKFIIISLVIAIIIFLIPKIREIIIEFLRLNTGKNLNDLTSGRIYLYTNAIEDFFNNPILGSGWGYYKYKYAHIYSYAGQGFYMDVHNIYIQLLCEVGILGFIAFITPIFSCVFSTFRLLKKNSIGKINLLNDDRRYLRLSLFIQAFFILYGLTGNPLYDYWVFLIYIMGVCMFLSVYNFKYMNKYY